VNSSVDIAVVGGGAAGLAAAVSAARAGRTTVLIDQRDSAGGTGGFSGLTTLCGLYDDAGNFLNEGIAREFSSVLSDSKPMQMGRAWVLPYQPARFRELAARLVSAEPNLQTSWNTTLANVVVENRRIVSLNSLSVGAVIDCSGFAEVARAAGADCLATDETTQAPAVIFPLRGVTRPLDSTAAVAQVLLPLVRAGFPPLSFHPGSESGEITVKFTGQPAQVPQVIAFLQSNIAGFEHCLTPLTEFPLAQRAGRMIIGKHLLTGAEVLAGKKFPDAVARCAWPVEQWSADGIVRFRYLPKGAYYEIPARALQAAAINNLFMAGKTISADADAIASARVMGCCLATGAAAGQLAARFLDSGGKQ
jgi:hypothetical protein